MPDTKELPAISIDWTKVNRAKMINGFCDGFAELANGTDTPLDNYAIEFVRATFAHESPRIFLANAEADGTAKKLPGWIKPILIQLISLLF